MADFAEITNFIKNLFGDSFVPLHEPRFSGNEKKYLNDCIDSTFVSSVGKYVDRLEKDFAEYTGSGYSVAAVNGTCALHTALKVVGVNSGDEVLTQPLTFIATANAISYCGASPVFIDVDLDTLGMSPESLSDFLNANCSLVGGKCVNSATGKVIKACVPMHTFGHPCRIDKICEICAEWHIPVIEDAAESLGSTYKGRHTGTFGILGVFSFNGNKIITSGGGGVIVTDDELLARRAKHITTTAKQPHKWEYVHDEVGFNYRMPNLNAALLCAQLEQVDGFLKNKRELADIYRRFFETSNIEFFKEPDCANSNYWLNAVILSGLKERDNFLEYSNSNGVMTRPIWRLMNKLSMFSDCFSADLKNSEYLEERVVNIPSSARLG
ncbi:LegC family aminotransferase [Seleniivibrio woodruffii]|uniref:GDP-perosamine synthase n=1 Tax=Seleniivibrio woodruffii TaxID=1078050 RepID=A0A4R1KCL6_9BACT|nr:LegC family aminotransferase [Seleniivibrio woodruffii]TCK62348.1 aminotransferase in exopolysaccharide biosynthesis [Seleniivibrio woodruffii]TVZ34535.1 aminotransferase in exopolysaccharide biosynthesis [Seleniivibrio woodruffii]